jgi:flagellar biosynthesis protein FliP
VNIQLLILFTILSVAPSILIMMTSFVRIVIVLSFLRTALGIQQPPNQVILALSLFMTFFIMSPTLDSLYKECLVPMRENKLTTEQGLEKAGNTMKSFMLRYTREKDIKLFMDLASKPITNVASPEDLPLTVVTPAYMLSEIKTAFQMGLYILIPFLVIDMIVASILLSMGMMMLPPPVVALPLKLMVFVLVDGWSLIIKSIISSFQG